MIRRFSVFNRRPSPSRNAQAQSSSDTPETLTRDLSHFLDLQKVNYRRALDQHQAKQWTVVMGNEAGDLDSIASAVAFAWYATTHLKQLTIPLVQTPRADLTLRAENLYVLSRVGIDTSTLLTSDEIPPPSGETYALVDHNKLAPRFVHISTRTPDQGGLLRILASPVPTESKVSAIVDHHQDEGAHQNANPRVIEPAGSCSSLVTRLFSSISGATLPQELAFLLLSAIVIDTNALKEGGKALAVDHDAVAWLTPFAAADLPSVQGKDDANRLRSLRELNETLQAKKSDVGHLSTRDLLRRDYKDYTLTPSWNSKQTLRAGLATVPRRLKGLFPDQRPTTAGAQSPSVDPNIWNACAEYMSENELDVLGVLTTWREEGRLGTRGRHRREQVWLVRGAHDCELAKRLWAGLEGSKTLRLKRKEGKRYACAVDGCTGSVYEQGDASVTRKATAPLLREVIEGRSTST